MVATAMRGICRFLVVSVMMLSFQSAWAGMIGTQQAVAAGGPHADRVLVNDLLSRSELQRELQSLGVDPSAVRDRVAAMTDEEVKVLAGNLQTAPAGGLHGWLVVAAIAVIAFMIWGSAPRR